VSVPAEGELSRRRLFSGCALGEQIHHRLIGFARFVTFVHSRAGGMTNGMAPPSPYTPLSRRFFAHDAPTLARALLGQVLVHESTVGRTAGIIVETEAYDETDPASHSAHGLTPRTAVMFGPAGHAYVYFSYGTHWCMNVVADRKGRGAAVLLRALEPLEGLSLMAERRGLDLSAPKSQLRLARGPGCLTQAMGIDAAHNGVDLYQGPLRVMRLGRRRSSLDIGVGPRIGVSKATAVPWRFFVVANPFVSQPPKDRPQRRMAQRSSQ